jgi:hypothetical protein
MKFIKYSLIVAVLATFTSCLKGKQDLGGILSDKGSIVTLISEKAYINTDAQNIGFGYADAFANFNFTKRANEDVKFFTLKISQPRENKLNGPLVVKVTATPLAGLTALPAGALTVTDITVPASTDPLITFPVLFKVNKTLLDVNEAYGVSFKLTSVSQGSISGLDDNIDVIINASSFSGSTNVSDYEAAYSYESSIEDPAKELGLNNRKPVCLIQASPTLLEYDDYFAAGFGAANSQFLIVNNFFTGARVGIFIPGYTIDATGKITGIQNLSGSAAVTALAVDASGENTFVYTANNVRTLKVKYSFTYTSTINGVVTPRTIKVSENFSYDPNQIYF